MKHLIPLFVSIGLVVALVLSGCGPAATGPGAGPAEDKVYRVLNPQGDFVPVDTKPLAPRLDTLDGKTIYVNQGEPDPVIMPALWERLNREYPKVNWKLIASNEYGPNSPETEVLENADAVIRGNGW